MISTLRFCIKNVTGKCFVSYSKNREALMLQKMIKKGLTSKKPKSNQKKILSKGLLFSPYDNEDCSHRITILNKNYMEYVNVILQNRDCGRRLMDLGIQVTKVNITKDYQFLNIYFASKNFDTPENVKNEILNEVIVELQKEIGALNYTKRAPFVRFIKDARLENAMKIDKIFEVMDLGRNYEPVNEKKVVTPNWPTKQDKLPEMRQNVLGIEVDKIKENISAEIKRFKAVKIEPDYEDDDTKHEFPEKLISFNKKEFYKFYKRRRIEELKRRKIAEREMYHPLDDIDYKPNNLYEYDDDDEFENLEGEDMK